MVSAEQNQWVEITAAVRAGLAKWVELMPAMNADEIASLASAIDTSMWNEIKAHTHDEAVEERRRTLERQAAFGG